jgi:predicted RNase H-like nuclease (RuvC/YqgF family)
MTQDISYWLNEVQTLQQLLATTYQERDQAYADSTNWRTRYEMEAKQRQTEVQRLQGEIAQLKQENAQLRGEPIDPKAPPLPEDQRYQALEMLEDPMELRQQLKQKLQAYDRLLQTLQAERQAHRETRQNLTLALGDAVDRLAQLQDSAALEES